ncbi:non-ribosomal peptide synthetase [Streptosporangium oxazolinicum]|uniref:Non-ribosomal peptide synthetase n=1 Tax=Streptosporangium oxazolinicum TaxID=909287 RepID=A0ABP8ALD1_9ACTN
MAHARFPYSAQFNALMYQRFTGPVDADRFAACLEQVLRRNDAFRLRFGEDERDGTPYQWAGEDVPAVRIVDLSGAADPRVACEEWLRQSFDRPLDVREGATVEATVLRESETAAYVSLKVHHIIADAWGLKLAFDQVRTDYAGKQVDDPPRYLDRVAEDTAYLASPDHDADREYFRTALSGVTPALFERRAPSGTRTSARHSFPLPSGLAETVRARGQSPFAYVAAAFATYLSRIHRCGEVVLGVPLADRRSAAARRTVGHFANTLPLRVNVSAAETVRDLVDQIQAGGRLLQRHERFSMGDLLRDRPRGEPREMFDVTLSYIQWPDVEPVPRLRHEAAGTGTRAHDQEALAVVVNEPGDGAGMTVDLDYALDVFDEDFPIEALARHVSTLLAGAVAEPGRGLATLPMSPREERADLIELHNATARAFPADQTLHGLIGRRAGLMGSRTAVTASHADPSGISYEELEERANRLAWALREDGVRVGDRVAVMLDRSPDMLVGILAVLKAGGAYVPIDPGYPAGRIALLLADCGARVVITSTDLPEPVSGSGPRVRLVTDPAGGTAGGTATPRTEPPSPPVTSRDLAYAIYTSGSTGHPKGVMVEHRSVVNRLAWMQRRYPIGDGDVILQKTPISFDVSVWELFWWAIEGARLAQLPPGAEKDPAEILRAIERERVTVLHFVPSMFEAFLDLADDIPDARARAASLRHVFCSGEALTPSQVTRFNRIFRPDGEGPGLVNLYGPTEATVDVSYFDCPAGPVTRVPIGRPIDNIRLYVLDPAGLPQPVGAPGELCVSGVGVARGYLGRPDLTDAVFVPDPFVPGERMYRTGDLARRLAGGELEYLGRLDGQVKIRGNRVELEEVRHHLATAPGVGAAVVIDRDTPERGAHLVGYYVAESELDPSVLRAHLVSALPEFMIPARFVRIDAIPLTPNGKTDRRALPEPTWSGGDDEPSTEAEAVLAAVWARVLGVPRVGAHDDYYVLGGDSILMLRIRAEAAARGVHVTLADMVRNPTLSALAAHARTDPAPEPGAEPFALVAGIDRARLTGAEDAYPVTRMQLGLLYHSRTHEGSAMYHDVFRYTFEVAWDATAFAWAADRVVARNPVLRSSFSLAGYSEPLQIVHPRAPGAHSIDDLRGLTAEDAEARTRAHIDERRLRGYDFEQASLGHFRAHVRDGTLDLVFSFHHAILDGWSAATLVGELLQDYMHALGTGAPAVAAADPLSAATYVREERRSLKNDASRRFWRDELDGATLVQFDPYVPHEPRGTGEFFAHQVPIPDDLTSAVREFARDHALAVGSVFLTAHCLTLRLLSGAPDVTTGLVIHGRPETPGSDRMTGLFLNTIPIRLRPGQESWLDTVRELVRKEREAHPHRRYPLSAIQDDRGGVPTIETAFNYVHLHVLEPLLRLPGLRLLDLTPFEQTNFNLLLHIIVDPRDLRLSLRLDCEGTTFTRSQAQVVARTYERVLRRIVERPDDPVDFGFLAPPPREVTPAGTPPLDVVTRFAARVAERPDAPAVTFGDRRWSYRELDRASDQIARRLLACGASREECVGIAMDRSPEMIAAVMGILKTGAACVPLDVTYPPERLAVMVEVARPLRVLAHSRHARLSGDPALLLPIESIPLDEPCEPVPVRIELDDIACVLFTSGSTGRPKGVELPHKPFAHYLEWQITSSTGAAGGKTLQFAPLSFDVSFQEIFSTLSGGGTLQLLTEEQRRDPSALARLMDAEAVERVFLPYVALQQLAETSDALGVRPHALRVVISSGEQLRVTEEIRKLLTSLPGVVLENQYGPTETHLVSRYTMTGDPARFPSLPPIGPPMHYLDVHVLNERMRPVPEGVAGEVYVGGVGLARGYRGQPELTARSFVRDPFGKPGDRLYRVGDRARALPGGDMVFLGRVDGQVKVRGFRVEPAEVEFAILALAAEHPGIREAAVVAQRRDGGDAFLAAFLVGDPTAVELGEVRKRLRATLPDYMVPSYFTWLPRLPITPSGKRDDTALRSASVATRSTAEATAPRDEYERALADIVADLLASPVHSVHDDFFESGGTSLAAMRLIVMIEKHFGVHVPLSALTATPTIADLAARLRDGSAETTFDPLVPIRPQGGRRPLFLVHPLGGNVLCYLRLARHLPDDQPVYALQAAGTEPGTEPLRSVADLAASYLRSVRRIQPEGPLALGGWSFGGYVAFEMARQLQLAGETAEPLIMLDTIGPEPGHIPDAGDDSLLEWFFWELLWSDQGGMSEVEAIPAELNTETDRIGFVIDRATKAGILPPGTSQASVLRLFELYKANWSALLNYRPGTTDVDVTLLKATDPLPDVLKPMHTARTAYHDPANGWTAYTAGRVDVVPVPGDHLVLLDEPNVRTVAQIITNMTQSGGTGK